eukprot:s3923_g4.t1
MVVCNDWHSALVPMLIHAEKTTTGKWRNTKTAFLCHNAVFQGRFQREERSLEGLAGIFGVPERYIDSITFKMPLRIGKYNEKITCVNTMAAGLRYCDRALTVSPSYAVECCTDPEKGVELESLFTLGKCTGILNGVKEGVSPSDKNFVTKTMMSCGPYNSTNCDIAKSELKASYRAQNGLTGCTGPLMCFIGRLDSQKGYDLLLESLDTEMQVVIVGAGRADLVAQTKAVEKKFPDKFFYAGWMGPERYALLAGCDFTLLPSRWEPCGLVQMEAMRLGTLPIVAPTGGLKDTVEDGVNGLWTEKEMTVEAVIEEEPNSRRAQFKRVSEMESVSAISQALKRASKLFTEEPAKAWAVVKMKQAAMAAAAEFTWSNAALQYEQIFTELGVKDVLNGKTATVTLETDKQVLKHDWSQGRQKSIDPLRSVQNLPEFLVVSTLLDYHRARFMSASLGKFCGFVRANCVNHLSDHSNFQSVGRCSIHKSSGMLLDICWNQKGNEFEELDGEPGAKLEDSISLI